MTPRSFFQQIAARIQANRDNRKMFLVAHYRCVCTMTNVGSGIPLDVVVYVVLLENARGDRAVRALGAHAMPSATTAAKAPALAWLYGGPLPDGAKVARTRQEHHVMKSTT